MKNTLGRGPIYGGYGLTMDQRQSLAFIFLGDRAVESLDHGFQLRVRLPITQTPLFTLFDSFQSRFMICQNSYPPNIASKKP